MATNQLSLLRQWHMLRLVPRAPAKISVRDLCDQLADADFPVTSRTVQRDLNELACVFPLVADDRDKPYGWSWQRDASSFDLPGLSIPEALTLTLVEQHLGNHLPPSTVDALQPHFKSAARALSAVDGSAMSKAWLNKVRSVPPQQPLLPPAMNDECQRTVYLALMKDLQLRLHYRKRDAGEATVYGAVHPLAIVQRGGVIYLACMFAGYDDVRTIALHRVERAEMLYEPARAKAGFDLDAYIASGQFGVLTGAPITLRATFSRAAGEHLYETPLAAGQVLVAGDDGIELSATVPDTRGLVFWLLGFGDGVTVLEPAALREEIKAIAGRMAAAYA
ncbi:WYL domain-containing protein [Massilia sp. RP-1-19]|uniref:WYL domain-containing protein n=1 Tax=Massilia polaris TaxID=2728846 RepID=A0A848HEL9_9BURK|nr:WYL domain-containing protein [Massilia polaris]NML59895.1 WYL domain-containing protein [Massilia polaris]